MQSVIGSSGYRTLNWRRRLDETYGVLEEFQHCAVASKLCSCMLRYARRLGVTNLLAGEMPPPRASRREQLSHVLLDAWPREWSERYFTNGYLYRDPTIRLVKRINAPFLWSELGDLCELDSRARRVMDEAGEFRLKEGLTFAFSTVERRPVGFSLAGEKLDTDPSERAALEFIAVYALGCAIVLAEGNRSRAPVHLSPRQHDVLRWASEGLTVNQIADRLGISDHTADTHLRMVRERFGVTSTVQAVAEALRLGLIA